MPETCDKYGTFFIANGTKAVSNGRWGADTAQCIKNIEDHGFEVTRAEHNKNGVAAYPSIYEGMWPRTDNITPKSILPRSVNQTLNDGLVSHVKYGLSASTGDKYNLAYDIWFSADKPTTDHKLELMIWLRNQGGISPIGKKLGTFIEPVSKVEFEVWEGWLDKVHVVSYLSNQPSGVNISTSIHSFVRDLLGRAFLKSTDYLTSVQFGAELWRGGKGIKAEYYTLTPGKVNSVAPNHTPEQIRNEITGGPGYPYTFHQMLSAQIKALEDAVKAAKKTIGTIPGATLSSAGPFWTVTTPEDDVDQQLMSRFATGTDGGFMNIRELLNYGRNLTETLTGAKLPRPVVIKPTPTVPQNFVAKLLSDGRIQCVWDPFPGAKEYKLYESASPQGVPGNPISGVMSNRGPFTEKREYIYWVTAVMPDGSETKPSQHGSVSNAATSTPSSPAPAPSPGPIFQRVYAREPRWASRWAAGEPRDGTAFQDAGWNYQSAQPKVVGAKTPYNGYECQFEFQPNGAQNPGPKAERNPGARRCELQPNVAIDPKNHPIDFLRFDIRLVEFPVGTNLWNVFYQAKGDGTGSPPMEMSIERGRWVLIFHDNSGNPFDKVDLGAVVADPNQINSIVLQVDWGPKGSISAWLNAVQTVNKRGAQTMHAGKGSYHKLGMYASPGLSGPIDVRFAHVAIADTLEKILG